jgi:F-type H+-transporting ATPase subunit a
MSQLSHPVEQAGEAAKKGFDAGETIIGHVSNSSLDHPLIHLPKVIGIDMSVTKHVLMLWIVATLLFLVVTVTVRRYIRQERLVPTGFTNALEFIVEYIRDEIVRPNVGNKWVGTWTPLLLTLFFFILSANLIGLVPIFDVLALVNHTILHPSGESFLAQVIHGGTTATGNYNVTAALATITFFAIIIAGSLAHGFVKHWANMIPPGLPWSLLLLPIEIMSMFVRPFALTMRLAANMTGGHIAVLSLISFVFIFAQMFQSASVGIGVGVVAVSFAGLLSVLEVLVVLIQAYVFTLLSAVFIGLAIHAHH